MENVLKGIVKSNIDDGIKPGDEVFILPRDFKLAGTDMPVGDLYSGMTDDDIIIMKNGIIDGELKLLIILCDKDDVEVINNDIVKEN